MTLALTNFIEPLISFGSNMVNSSARLAHVADGAQTLLPTNARMSRYTTSLTGDALQAITDALSGIDRNSGITNTMTNAVRALQAADLADVIAVAVASTALSKSTSATLGQAVADYVSAIKTTAPADAIGLLFTLANSMPITLNDAPLRNYVRNSYALGMFAGQLKDSAQVAVVPTWWNIVPASTWAASGLTAIMSQPAVNMLDIAVSGTSLGSSLAVQFEQANAIPASAGQTWTVTVDAQIISGSIPVSTVLQLNQYTSAGAHVTDAVATIPISTTKQTHSLTTTITGSTVAYVRPQLYWSLANGTVFNATVRCGNTTAVIGPQPVSISPYVVMLYVMILCALGQAILAFSPTTSQEVSDIISQYVSLFDATVTPCSDFGWDTTVSALGRLRASVLGYLQQQLAIEPRSMTQNFGDSLPDVVAAYALYGDANRAGELVQMNNPTSPLAMPNQITYINRSASDRYSLGA